VIVELVFGWLTLVASAAYQANHARPTRRSIRERLIHNSAGMRAVLSEPFARAVMDRAARRASVARRTTRRRLVAGLLSVVSAALLLNAPVPDDRRSRHATGLETVAPV
jgi:type VI protein secretion system component VasF